MNEATLKIYPNASKTRKKDKTTSLYARVIINREKAEAKLPIRISEKECMKWNNKLMCVDDSKSEVNKHINFYKSKFDNFINRNFDKLSSITPIEIRNHLLDIKVKPIQNRVLEYVEDYYETKVLPSGEITFGTKKNYKKAIKHFKKFLQFNKMESILFENIKPDFGTKFYTYLTSNYPNQNKSAITKESASGNIKKIKKIFNDAISAELINRNPFKTIRIKIEHKRKEKLNINQVKEIFEKDLSKSPLLEKCRNIFLFQIFSGLSFSDMINLKQNQFVGIASGRRKFTTFRGKTNQEVQQIVNKYLQNLIDKFAKDPAVQIKGSVVPYINLKDYNERLKLIADYFEIPIPLSSHYGRHTFRQLLTEAEITDMGAIYSYMGWSNKKSMDSIYSNVTEKQLERLCSSFELYLSSYLEKNEKS